MQKSRSKESQPSENKGNIKRVKRNSLLDNNIAKLAVIHEQEKIQKIEEQEIRRRGIKHS